MTTKEQLDEIRRHCDAVASMARAVMDVQLPENQVKDFHGEALRAFLSIYPSSPLKRLLTDRDLTEAEKNLVAAALRWREVHGPATTATSGLMADVAHHAERVAEERKS